MRHTASWLVSLFIAGAALAAVCAPLAAQSSDSRGTPTGTVGGPTASTATTSAARLAQPPLIDGRDDDAVWQPLIPVRGFRQSSPSEDANPAFNTEFRVGYDDKNFYVLVRAFDPRPDSIRGLLARRDVKTNSDEITVIIDGFLDRRNAIQLMVNAAGVKRDGVIHSDAVEDMSWDGVWDVAVLTDDKGWIAEYRVPFSQLRFAERPLNTFGFGVRREIARLNQRDSWPLFRPTTRALASQLGTVEALRDVPGARRIEVLPYAVTKSVPDLSRIGASNRTEITGGIDLRAGIGSSLTVDATVNPDFGQVESDPAILNLTAFEVRFDERRTFFQEGIGLFRCGPSCDGPFYTRRIGRTPQLRSAPNDPAFTTILGAGKLTGRFANGYTLAVLNAVTREEHGATGKVIEPQTNYFVMRVARESRNGARSAGLLVTDVRRRLDDATSPLLRSSATGIVGQVVSRFGQQRYELLAYSGVSYVAGSAAAIAATQRSSVHYFQRPDHGEERYDPTRTSLFGGAAGAGIKKIRGAVKFETFVRRSTPGQEMNDMGLIPTVNDMSIRQSVDFQQQAPTRWIRSSFSQLSAESHWTVGGLPNARMATLHASASLHNSWAGALTINATDLGGVNCVSCARGGPALRRSPGQTIRIDIIGDPRMKFQPQGQVHFGRSDEGRSFNSGSEMGFNLRVASQFSASLAVGYDLTANDQQWVGNRGALISDTTHYTFARLDQRTLSVTSRLNWTATPNLSFQFYGQPFVSAGSYSSWRELRAPRAPDYDDRFRPYGGGAAPAGFNVKQFNSNAVARWEYRPGSAIFLVWQQGRAQSLVNPGSFEAGRDIGDLFSAPPQNTVLVKFSYWFNP